MIDRNFLPRVGELCALTWDQVDFGQGLLHVTRLRHGVPSVHRAEARSFARCGGYGESSRRGDTSSRPRELRR